MRCDRSGTLLRSGAAWHVVRGRRAVPAGGLGGADLDHLPGLALAVGGVVDVLVEVGGEHLAALAAGALLLGLDDEDVADRQGVVGRGQDVDVQVLGLAAVRARDLVELDLDVADDLLAVEVLQGVELLAPDLDARELAAPHLGAPVLGGLVGPLDVARAPGTRLRGGVVGRGHDHDLAEVQDAADVEEEALLLAHAIVGAGRGDLDGTGLGGGVHGSLRVVCHPQGFG